MCVCVCVTVCTQRTQLAIILTSLQDNSHVASVLGFTTLPATPQQGGGTGGGGGGQKSVQSDTQLAEILMKTLLRNLGFHTVGLSLYIYIYLYIYIKYAQCYCFSEIYNKSIIKVECSMFLICSFCATKN